LTPHRFHFWLANAADRDAALAALARLAAELSVESRDEPDGRVRFELTSTFAPQTAAILRPLNTLDRAGIAVRSFETHDLVTEVDETELAQAVAEWDRFGNIGPHRRRLEALSGSMLLETCVRRMLAAPDRATAESPRRAVWRFAVSCVAANTPGSEERMLSAALAVRDEDDALAFVDAAMHRANLARLTGEPFDAPEDALVALIGRRSYLGERAAWLAQSMPGPLPEAVTFGLCAAARASGESAIPALGALHNAAPSLAVRETVEDALASREPNRQATALAILAHHWGAEARPTWQVFLASRSAPLRQTAEAVLGLHGTVEDLPEAAEHLARLARTKSGVQQSPPRGAEIVDLLVRYREHPAASAALDDLSARWGSLGDDLREWLEEHYPWLDPARRHDEPHEQQAEPEERLEWPPPLIEREGNTFTLWFDDTDLFETRDRFEDLVRAHPAVRLMDSDREWISLQISGRRREALIHELWAAAHVEQQSAEPSSTN
jgi:hypothetical protein